MSHASAVGREAKIIYLSRARALRRRMEPITASWLWQRLIGRLADVRSECSTPGWDGTDAMPVSSDAVRLAERFISLLPDGVEEPNIVGEPDGAIAFTWDKGQDLILSISIDDQHLVYAGIFGASRRQHGEEVLRDVLPKAILELLQDYFPGPVLDLAADRA